jgi:hypothetical protein
MYTEEYERNLGDSPNIDLSLLNDAQKLVLSEMPYIDFTEDGLKKIRNGGLTISEMSQYLLTPNDMSSGYPLGTKEKTEELLGEFGNGYQTDAEICQKLQALGFGDMVITDVSMDPDTGFCAMTFKDENGNTGISFRGSDFDWSNGAASDWFISDIGEHFIGSSPQADNANDYFKSNCDPNGSNYIYGYSLGGNLVSHTYLENHENIAGAFSINGNPISPSLLDTQSKIDAFNSQKYEQCMIEGDIVSIMKPTDLYQDNIRVIKNVDGVSMNFMNSHGLQSAMIGEDGNFIEIPYAEMERNLNNVLGKKGMALLDVIQSFENSEEIKIMMKALENSEKIITSIGGAFFGSSTLTHHDSILISHHDQLVSKTFQEFGQSLGDNVARPIKLLQEIDIENLFVSDNEKDGQLHMIELDDLLAPGENEFIDIEQIFSETLDQKEELIETSWEFANDLLAIAR